MRKTKIVATIGPASDDVEIIKKMISAGMNAARINFSHGSYETHAETIKKIKQARKELNAPIPLILDTRGPEIRIKTFDKESVYLKQGEKFTLTTDDVVGDETRVAVTYANLPDDLKIGGRVLIDDGLIELKVESVEDGEIRCEIVNSGFLSSHKGVNVPDVYVNLPSLTEKDIEDIQFGVEHGFDYIAVSFVRSANDVLNVREVIEQAGGEDVMIISKIENRDGVDNIDDILELSDGIMVARGDLGVEIPPEEVPVVQKTLIRKANEKGKPVITATQMLESMVNNPRPTRAEANDVANAIFDGSDAIMLSGETAKGHYPEESVYMMAKIAEGSEKSIDYSKFSMMTRHVTYKTTITNAIGFAACTTAADLSAACIVAVTDSGFTPRMVSHFRPACPILAVTKNAQIWRKLNLAWGCVPVLFSKIDTEEHIFNEPLNLAVKYGLAKDGDPIVIAAGIPTGVPGTTNTIRVVIVGDVITRGEGYGDKTVAGYANVIKVIEEAEKYFRPGDILVTTKTTNEMMPYIKKASAIVVGSWEKIDHAHSVTVAKALDKPLIISGQKVIDLIRDGFPITVDTEKGIVYNGIRQ
ncbi:MAG: pyruvate kinase [Clostridiales bacterium]|jgi:pyruvate kinase|nr:pyruvate kinase [Clostridiales bacterium]